MHLVFENAIEVDEEGLVILLILRLLIITILQKHEVILFSKPLYLQNLFPLSVDDHFELHALVLVILVEQAISALPILHFLFIEWLCKRMASAIPRTELTHILVVQTHHHFLPHLVDVLVRRELGIATSRFLRHHEVTFISQSFSLLFICLAQRSRSLSARLHVLQDRERWSLSAVARKLNQGRSLQRTATAVLLADNVRGEASMLLRRVCEGANIAGHRVFRSVVLVGSWQLGGEVERWHSLHAFFSSCRVLNCSHLRYYHLLLHLADKTRRGHDGGRDLTIRVSQLRSPAVQLALSLLLSHLDHQVEDVLQVCSIPLMWL